MAYRAKAEPRGYADGVPVYCAYDEIVDVATLIPNPKNPNTHPDEQLQLLGRIIRQTGWRQPITVSKLSGFMVKGHGRLGSALLEGLKEAPVEYQNYTSEAEEYADLVADNRIAELAELNNQMLADIFAEIDPSEIPMELTGYTEDEAEALKAALSEALEPDTEDEDELPELPEPGKAVTQRGDLWILGKHRVVCGNSTDEGDMALLLGQQKPEILLTDPPYCSGGFQESGKSTGSIGSKQSDGSGGWIQPTISSDNLSTRGYQVLMKAVLAAAGAKVAYIFTDWRMWVYLFDLVEGSGLGVRNMIVWNKKSPGMGNGWRAQHELIMFAHRTKPKWDNHKGYGNVLEASRSGNELHPTQKPVEVVEALLDNTRWAHGVLDPFGGSGTTLIAAENTGQSAWIMEMEPGNVDTIVRRYVKATGDDGIELVRNGEAVDPSVYEGLIGE